MDEYVRGVAETRENFSAFLDDAESSPGYIKRKRKYFNVVSSELLETSIPCLFEISFGYDKTGSESTYFTKNDLIPDVIGFGNTKEEAVDSFVEDIRSLCEDFLANPQIYSIAPNRKEQLPALVKASSILVRKGDLRNMIIIGDD